MYLHINCIFLVTNRPMADFETDGETCWFVSEERMLDGIATDEFLDVGKHDNYLFGTPFSSVRNVMTENKLCIVDCKPEVNTLENIKKNVRNGKLY